MNKEQPLVRVQAAKALAEVLSQEKSLGFVLPYYSEGLSVKDQSLLQELCFGVCRHAHQFSVLTKKLLQKPLKGKDRDIQALLYLGMYQLLHTRIPDHAAIGATVEASRKLNKPWAKGLINGVLRNIQRQTDEDKAKFASNLQYTYSHPQWMAERLRSAWPDDWQSILTINNSRPPFTLRINTRKTSRQDYLKQLADADISASETPFSPYGITLDQPTAVTNLPLFEEGIVSVQDEAAQLACDLMDLKPQQHVLDACCAPGGKTCHILEQQTELASMTAIDQDPARMPRVKENLQRLKLDAILKVSDASDTNNWWSGTLFDRILLDAPCSATGVIRRHPDIKLLRRISDITNLAELQKTLLSALWQTLKPNGRLVYATCSVFPMENEHVVEAFLKETINAKHIPIQAEWGHLRPYGRQLFPQKSGHDGFYYAILEKQE